jgi:hypothetical protein
MNLHNQEKSNKSSITLNNTNHIKLTITKTCRQQKKELDKFEF